MKLLDTPAKRLGALIVLAGLVLLVYGFTQLGRFTGLESCLVDFSGARGCRQVRWGFWLAVGGLVLAPVLGWIWHGKAARNR